ncbi:MAG: DNA repair protein RecN [Bacteroidia bacterium]|nr:DNA repair protein RecN [Bacteroidia bacterium]
MLQSLYIRNYVLISNLEMDFHPGFSTVTGETGAGKSILMGALSLILGQRADTGVLKDKTKKCIVEGRFNIANYSIESFFKNNELDYEDQTLIRREIGTDGKSRAFINDTPVNVSVLKEIGPRLVDIHSQHQNLILSNNQFQLKVVDTYARHNKLLQDFKKMFFQYKQLKSDVDELREKSAKSKSDLDYFQFQFDQLHEAKLTKNEQAELEKELEILTHAEDIKTNLTNAAYLFSEREKNIISELKSAQTLISGLQKVLPEAEELTKRIESSIIEIKDIAGETESLSHTVEFNPERVSLIHERLGQIYSLQQKHRVNSVAELIKIRDDLEAKIQEIASYDSELEKSDKQISQVRNELTGLSGKISAGRNKAVPVIEKDILSLLKQLGMPNASFKVVVSKSDDFSACGMDKVLFTFSANKNIELQDISKVASGGELSRLMLAIKSLIAGFNNLPTIIFDEIDSGVSGEIADKTGNIMKEMSSGMQVVGITHLPQIASKGDQHYVVYKTEGKQTTTTNIRLLDKDERITEIAKMLSGSQLTEAAISNAIELLNARIK